VAPLPWAARLAAGTAAGLAVLRLRAGGCAARRCRALRAALLAAAVALDFLVAVHPSAPAPAARDAAAAAQRA